MIDELEIIIARTLGAGIAKKMASEIWQAMKNRSNLDEEAVVALREMKAHCQALIDLIDRTIDVLD